MPRHEGFFHVHTGGVFAGPPEHPLPRIPAEIPDRQVWATGYEVPDRRTPRDELRTHPTHPEARAHGVLCRRRVRIVLLALQAFLLAVALDATVKANVATASATTAPRCPACHGGWREVLTSDSAVRDTTAMTLRGPPLTLFRRMADHPAP